MKHYLVLILSLTLIFASCTNRQPRVKQSSQITVNATDVLAGENFDLQALGEIVKKTSNPQELEKILNTEGGINNLDLDGNGNTDVIKVTEYGSAPNIGLSFCAILEDGEPEIASIEINTTTNEVVLAGNETYYGTGSYYTSRYSPADYMLFAYLARPHSIYHSPYYYGHYGSYYRPYRSVGYHSYSSRGVVSSSRKSTTYTKTTTRKTSKITSPNKTNVSKKATATANKKSAAVKKSKTNRSVSDTKKSQKSMTARDKNKAIKGGGFKSTTPKQTTATKSKPKSSSQSSSSQSSSSRSSSSQSSSSQSSSSQSGSSRSSSSRSSSSRSSSSRRCDVITKENIVKYDTGLSKALAMTVYTYNYTDKYVIEENLPSTTQVGFIAQEMQDILPEAVMEDNSLLAIDYATISANNTKAIQELNKVIQLQNTMINMLLADANLSEEQEEILKELVNN